MSGVKYCVCSSKHCLRQQDGWEPYVERKDILVWRKEHQCKKGLYHYKLYGKFDDVNVWEFLAVQLDLSKYRLGWDTTTSQCREVDTQTLTSTAPGDNDNGNSVVSTQHQNKSQAMVYYWEVQYPAFFSNRCSIILCFLCVLFVSMVQLIADEISMSGILYQSIVILLILIATTGVIRPQLTSGVNTAVVGGVRNSVLQ